MVTVPHVTNTFTATFVSRNNIHSNKAMNKHLFLLVVALFTIEVYIIISKDITFLFYYHKYTTKVLSHSCCDCRNLNWDSYTLLYQSYNKESNYYILAFKMLTP